MTTLLLYGGVGYLLYKAFVKPATAATKVADATPAGLPGSSTHTGCNMSTSAADLDLVEKIFGLPADTARCRQAKFAGAGMVDVYDSRNGATIITAPNTSIAAKRAADASMGQGVFGKGKPFTGTSATYLSGLGYCFGC